MQLHTNSQYNDQQNCEQKTYRSVPMSLQSKGLFISQTLKLAGIQTRAKLRRNLNRLTSIELTVYYYTREKVHKVYFFVAKLLKHMCIFIFTFHKFLQHVLLINYTV